jgi:hypothetical protein
MTDLEFEQTARAWLDDGPTQISDRALQAALDDVHVTRQRRAWGAARRTIPMNNLTRALAASAVVALGLGATALALRPSDGVGSQASPSPSLSVTASPRPLTLHESTTAAGTWVTGSQFKPRVTFTLPAGWSGTMPGTFAVWLSDPKGVERIAFETFDRVVADPCHVSAGLLDPLPGPSVGELATALATLPGIRSTTPTDVAIDGYVGKQLTLTAPASTAGCDLTDDSFQIWQLPLGAASVLAPGESERVSIVDVDGTRLVITARPDRQSPQEQAELQGLLDSIRLAPAN